MSLQISINRKPNGQHLRVTVEQKPVDITLLTELQATIHAQLTGFAAKDADNIHLTLLHIGIPQDIYFEFRHVNPELTFESFMSGFMDLMEKLYLHTQKYQSNVSIEGNSLNLYGSIKSPAVALSIVRNSQLEKLHGEVFTILVEHIEKQLKIDPINFVRTSRNFRHSPPEVFNPHITLGRIPNKIDKLPSLSASLPLIVGPPYLAQVTVV